MPVNRCRLGKVIGEADCDARALRREDQRPGLRSVEAVHQDVVAGDAPVHEFRHELEGVAVTEGPDLSRPCFADCAVGSRQPGCGGGRQRHFRWQHRDVRRHRNAVPARRFRRWRHGAERELIQVRWAHPVAGRLTPQQHRATRLRRHGSRFGADQHQEAIERDFAGPVDAVRDRAEALDDIQRRRCGPRDVTRAGRRPRQAAQRDRERVPVVAIHRDGDGERSWDVFQRNDP